jgi:hypothetical protein
MDAPVNSADRLASVTLFAVAALAWLALGFVVLTVDPRSNAQALIYGALLLGLAAGATLAPLLWLVSFVRHRRIAYRGDWWRAGRRAALVGFVIVLFVLLRGQDALGLPLALFIVALALLVELTLSLRR